MTQFGMIALRDFDYNGVSYVRSQRFEVSAVHATILQRAQHARLTTAADTPPPPEPVVVPKPVTTRAAKTRAPRKPRTYKRRDLTAEHTS
jgi:hypothetical protein